MRAQASHPLPTYGPAIAVGLSGHSSSIPKMVESFSSLPSIFWYYKYLWKDTRNTAEHVFTKKILIYARARVNKDFVHSGSITLI